MIVTTIDPVTGNKVADPDHHPFTIEGVGVVAIPGGRDNGDDAPRLFS